MEEMICIKPSTGWQGRVTKKPVPGPKYDEIVHVVGSYIGPISKQTILLLEEYPMTNAKGDEIGYPAKYFVKAGDISELTEVLKEEATV
jgi:hypothetical protein